MNLYDVTCIEGESMTVTLLTSIVPNYVLNACPYIHREAYSFPLSAHQENTETLTENYNGSNFSVGDPSPPTFLILCLKHRVEKSQVQN